MSGQSNNQLNKQQIPNYPVDHSLRETAITYLKIKSFYTKENKAGKKSLEDHWIFIKEHFLFFNRNGRIRSKNGISHWVDK